MHVCPNEYTKSVDGIANYIGKKFSSNAAKLRAAYSWVAQNITYDLANVNKNITYKDENKLIIKTLRTRKAVCSGYTKTFKAIAGKLGLEIVEISGYTKHSDEISHAWCAVKVSGQWKLIDPTWSAGYIAAEKPQKFHKQFNDKWFLCEPNKWIKTHIPFDPVWQFSYFPINSREFSTESAADSITARFFSYPDTINIIRKLSEKERLLAANKRIAAAGVANTATERHIAANIRVLESIENNEKVEKYNQAVYLYNKASSLYNNSIKNPKNSTNKLRDANSKLTEAQSVLSEIKQADEDLTSSVVKLWKSINTLKSNIAKIL